MQLLESMNNEIAKGNKYLSYKQQMELLER